MLFLSRRLQVVCAALLLLAAGRTAVAAASGPARGPAPAVSVRAALR